MLFLLLTACGPEPTPDGWLLLDVPVGTPSGETRTVEVPVVLGDVSPSTLSVTMLTDGASMGQLTVAVQDAGGWSISASPPGNPVNMGSLEAPMMRVPVLITRQRQSGCTHESRTQMVAVSADGTAELD